MKTVQMTMNSSSKAIVVERLVQMYPDAAVAAMREAVANAVDAVRANGSGEVRIETSDSGDAVRYRVTDTGTGMSVDEFRDRFLSYGFSAKGDSDVGGFGLGAKAPLAACESFTVRTVKGGWMVDALVSRDGAEVEERRTDADSGTVVEWVCPRADLSSARFVETDVPLFWNGQRIGDTWEYLGVHETRFGGVRIARNLSRMEHGVSLLVDGTVGVSLGGWNYSNTSEFVAEPVSRTALSMPPSREEPRNRRVFEMDVQRELGIWLDATTSQSLHDGLVALPPLQQFGVLCAIRRYNTDKSIERAIRLLHAVPLPPLLRIAVDTAADGWRFEHLDQSGRARVAPDAIASAPIVYCSTSIRAASALPLSRMQAGAIVLPMTMAQGRILVGALNPNARIASHQALRKSLVAQTAIPPHVACTVVTVPESGDVWAASAEHTIIGDVTGEYTLLATSQPTWHFRTLYRHVLDVVQKSGARRVVVLHISGAQHMSAVRDSGVTGYQVGGTRLPKARFVECNPQEADASTAMVLDLMRAWSPMDGQALSTATRLARQCENYDMLRALGLWEDVAYVEGERSIWETERGLHDVMRDMYGEAVTRYALTVCRSTGFGQAMNLAASDRPELRIIGEAVFRHYAGGENVPD